MEPSAAAAASSIASHRVRRWSRWTDRNSCFDTPTPSDCVIEPDTLTFGFVIGDNEVTLGGGANLYNDGWLGNILLGVINEDGLPVQYYPADDAMDGNTAIDGDSMSFSGPMVMKPPNDGTNPPAEDVGEGTISVTCG